MTYPALSGLSLTLRLVGGSPWQGVVKNARVLPEGPISTDVAGVIWGEFTSSDRINVEPQVEVLSEMGNLTQLAVIRQRWDTRAASDRWNYVPYFWAEEPTTVTLTLVLTDRIELGMEGHRNEFCLTKVVGWRRVGEERRHGPWVAYNPTYYNATNIQQEYGGYLIEACADLSAYAVFDPDSRATGDGGSASSELTVHEGADFAWLVNEVYFSAIDRSVWVD
jgi:hypothetical protein